MKKLVAAGCLAVCACAIGAPKDFGKLSDGRKTRIWRLQGDGGCIARFGDQYVAGGVHPDRQVVRRGKTGQVFNHTFLLLGRAGNLTDFMEKLPDGLGIGQRHAAS